MSQVDRDRALRRRHMHERQAVVFGVLLATLAVAGLGAAAIFTDAISVPFLDKGFSSEPSATARAQAVPCPPEGAKPVAYKKIKVTVYNGTQSPGLAGATGEALTERGFKVVGTENAPTSLDGTARITFGVKGVAAAYTLMAQLPDAQLRLDAREDATVDLIIGGDFTDLLPADDVKLEPKQPIEGLPDCVPFDQVTAPPTSAGAPATPAAG